MYPMLFARVAQHGAVNARKRHWNPFVAEVKVAAETLDILKLYRCQRTESNERVSQSPAFEPKIDNEEPAESNTMARKKQKIVST